MTTPLDEALHFLEHCWEERKPVVQVVPITSTGSVPCPVSARMAVSIDKVSGTIGGGAVEAEAIKEARDMIKHFLSMSSPIGEDKPHEKVKLKTFILRDEVVSNSGMTCGGGLRVMLEMNTSESVSVIKSIISHRKANRSVVDCIKVDKGSFKHILISLPAITSEAKIDVLPEVVSHVEKLLLGTEPAKTCIITATGGTFYVCAPVLSSPTLFVLGSGHVGQAVARIAPLSGFKVHIFDDREDMLISAKKKAMNAMGRGFGEKPITSSPSPSILESQTHDDNIITLHCVDMKSDDTHSFFGGQQEALLDHLCSYIIIVTRGHFYDLKSLRILAKAAAKYGKLPRYIGMIGSSRKIKMVRDALVVDIEKLKKEKETVKIAEYTQKILDLMKAPIGLPIGGSTPGEIAVSIVGEVIFKRTEGKKI
ncbi:XdhC family protein [Aduncisulcus paluster]|uniref:XdhC family protein n=1 Tax=Aduncisulcus paluster TaxID=2918883 RepID=A0ABQ5KRR9_9EUKA|nr:XdhC family protein [Aduncisulcus paluster]